LVRIKYNLSFIKSLHCLNNFSFCQLADLFNLSKNKNIYDCGWYLKRKNQIVDKLNVDWPESKFDFIIIPCWTQVSIIDKQTMLSFFLFSIHHTFLSLPQYQNQFFRPKMVFCTSPLCVIRFI